MEEQVSSRRHEWQIALTASAPVMLGYIVLGLGYGLYTHSLGFSWWVPTLMALTIYGGSVEFVIANMLTQAFNPLTVLVITLVVGFCQFFYSIAMLGKYKGHGFQKFFQIFSLTDETFVVNYQLRLGDDVDHQRVYTMVAALDYFYWVFGTWLGGTLGSILAIQIKGLDFAMTALFLVLALDQILKEKSHVSSVSGLVITVVCLMLVGSTYFLLGTLLLLVVEFTILYRRRTMK
ncbi:AzlC family ABC transporter permease [Limosilactobacillus fermentum]|uniref:AzlC family ABC transporter permease n=1 Tax=Limosilactobacillus fermentum TaxID=1613 RepID=UPI0008A6BDFF|nr:AzlC family ABC transporter permease [Limosilactobacillus fermentum]AOY86010.1 branched-chain amino acid ABC transporter permease [Limosilactobacillus fermentum]QID93571.1 branched-chain amino acid ABC transporter permease [Limosilactobacillus fermentum]